MAFWGKNEGFYSDIYYQKSNDKFDNLRKVEGGYVGRFCVKVGEQTVRLIEDSKDGYSVIKTLKLNVLDYDAESTSRMKSVLKACTTSSMTPFEKMSAVCHYILNDLNFKYPTTDGNNLIYLATQPNQPFYASLEFVYVALYVV